MSFAKDSSGRSRPNSYISVINEPTPKINVNPLDPPLEPFELFKKSRARVSSETESGQENH